MGRSKGDKAGSHVYSSCLSQRGKMRCGNATARGGVAGSFRPTLLARVKTLKQGKERPWPTYTTLQPLENQIVSNRALPASPQSVSIDLSPERQDQHGLR